MRLFITSAIGWSIIHGFRALGYPIPILNGYLTDLLAVPVMIHIALLFTRRFLVQDPSFRYPFSWILFISAYVSLVMEVVVPHFSPAYTADGWDAVVYFAGGICYHITGQYLLRVQPK
ncbi:hypothetical protein [Chitinophaga deserti]|uniref:hypothetical protein n=1 Tax=Chitinophaga deserti TaxID=2164099 RepID=UPI000D6CBCB2|nr:hypothetical protein [Chitinophaga deserti]